MERAPIILFTYKRPCHTLRTLEALRANRQADESLLIVYIDGPRANATGHDLSQIREVKEVIASEAWCKEVRIIESPVNKGLSRSISEGVSGVLEQYGRAIILEDDIVTGPHFLEYMNSALDLYKDDERVACISGYIYPVKQALPETFFLKGADCWGWATWSRAWKIGDASPVRLLNELTSQNKTAEFDFDNSYPYVQMLKDRIEGRNDSWAVLWYADAFLNDQLCLYPGRSLVHNIGNDGSGSHAGASAAWDHGDISAEIRVGGVEVKENSPAKKIVADYFRTLNPIVKQSLLRKVAAKIRSILKNN